MKKLSVRFSKRMVLYVFAGAGVLAVLVFSLFGLYRRYTLDQRLRAAWSDLDNRALYEAELRFLSLSEIWPDDYDVQIGLGILALEQGLQMMNDGQKAEGEARMEYGYEILSHYIKEPLPASDEKGRLIADVIYRIILFYYDRAECDKVFLWLERGQSLVNSMYWARVQTMTASGPCGEKPAASPAPNTATTEKITLTMRTAPPSPQRPDREPRQVTSVLVTPRPSPSARPVRTATPRPRVTPAPTPVRTSTPHPSPTITPSHPPTHPPPTNPPPPTGKYSYELVNNGAKAVKLSGVNSRMRFQLVNYNASDVVTGYTQTAALPIYVNPGCKVRVTFSTSIEALQKDDWSNLVTVNPLSIPDVVLTEKLQGGQIYTLTATRALTFRYGEKTAYSAVYYDGYNTTGLEDIVSYRYNAKRDIRVSANGTTVVEVGDEAGITLTYPQDYGKDRFEFGDGGPKPIKMLEIEAGYSYRFTNRTDDNIVVAMTDAAYKTYRAALFRERIVRNEDNSEQTVRDVQSFKINMKGGVKINKNCYTMIDADRYSLTLYYPSQWEGSVLSIQRTDEKAITVTEWIPHQRYTLTARSPVGKRLDNYGQGASSPRYMVYYYKFAGDDNPQQSRSTGTSGKISIIGRDEINDRVPYTDVIPLEAMTVYYPSAWSTYFSVR